MAGVYTYKAQLWGLVDGVYTFIRPMQIKVSLTDTTQAGQIYRSPTDTSQILPVQFATFNVPFASDLDFFTKSSSTDTAKTTLIGSNANLTRLFKANAVFSSNNMRIVFDSRRFVEMVLEGSLDWGYYFLDYYLDGAKIARLKLYNNPSSDQYFPSGATRCSIEASSWSGGYRWFTSAVTFPWLNKNNLIEWQWVKFASTYNAACDYSFCQEVNTYTAEQSQIVDWYSGIEPFDEDDPYPDVDNSTPSGPAEGTGIPANDPVDIPSLPTVSAIDTGFVSLFNPSLAEVKNLADYMWNNSVFDLNNFKKIFDNPMDCILGFNVVPVNVPSSGTGYVTVGNLVTTIAMTLATSQWVEVDCGSLNIGLPYGNYLDFAPSTKYSIYLPYIGVRELSTDDVAGKTLTLKYHVDVLSCSCVAYLKCGDSVLYQFAGSCGYSIPVTDNDFSQMISSIVDIGLSVGGAVAGGNGIGAVGSIAKDVMGLKPDIHRSGSIGSSAGLMGLQVPFLIIEIPNACKPKKQYHYLGYPSFVTVKLGDLSGFASFENVLLEGIPCTDAEREIILSMCKGGIYL